MLKGTEPQGKDLIARKIVRLFERLKCPPAVIMRTDQAGEEVDNGCGVEFDLPPYAVIHDEDLDKMKARSRIMGWQFKHRVTMMKFDVKGCASGIDALMCELEDRDGYKIVWKRAD